jgi:hypothetical protein
MSEEKRELLEKLKFELAFVEDRHGRRTSPAVRFVVCLENRQSKVRSPLLTFRISVSLFSEFRMMTWLANPSLEHER